jgi:hypothetical protein
MRNRTQEVKGCGQSMHGYEVNPSAVLEPEKPPTNFKTP